MLPSLIPSPSVSWQVLGPPQLPALHNLGKSFLIDNLLRINGPLNPPLRPIPANPVPVKVAQTAEQIGPSGGPHPTRSSFQLVNPSDNQPAPVTSTSQTVTYPDIGKGSLHFHSFKEIPYLEFNIWFLRRFLTASYVSFLPLKALFISVGYFTVVHLK